MDMENYEFTCYDQNFNELTDVIYDGSDVHHSTDDSYSVVGKVIYVGIMLKVDMNVQVYIY